MARKIRVEYAGALYHVMSRGDRREDIFLSDVDRQDFLKTLAEACQKTGFQVHAYCLMSNHFHLVLETPNANLVAGMRWLLSSYTLRLNHRHKLFGHVFSGRYKALLLDGSGNGYLKTVCDYVHLNPARARLLAPDERLIAYPWSSFIWYLASPRHRPSWIRTDRLLGAHGFQEDTPAARSEFEQRVETRRRSETKDDPEWKPLRRGWCFGSQAFKEDLLDQIDQRLGEHHSGEIKRETAERRAERIIAEELQRLGWNSADLHMRLKSDPAKLQIAARLRAETTVSIRWIAARLSMGTWKSATTRLHAWKQANRKPEQTPEGNVML